MQIDFVDENASQSINSKVPKSQFDTLECTLEEIAVFELIFKNHFYAVVSTDIHCKKCNNMSKERCDFCDKML